MTEAIADANKRLRNMKKPLGGAGALPLAERCDLSRTTAGNVRSPGREARVLELPAGRHGDPEAARAEDPSRPDLDCGASPPAKDRVMVLRLGRDDEAAARTYGLGQSFGRATTEERCLPRSDALLIEWYFEICNAVATTVAAVQESNSAIAANIAFLPILIWICRRNERAFVDR